MATPSPSPARVPYGAAPTTDSPGRPADPPVETLVTGLLLVTILALEVVLALWVRPELVVRTGLGYLAVGVLFEVTLFAVLAAAVAWRARDGRRRGLALLALAGALLCSVAGIGAVELMIRSGGDLGGAYEALRVPYYLSAAFLVAAAGLARRHGHAWALPVALAPVAVFLLRYAPVPVPVDRVDQAVTVLVGPVTIIAVCLVCWLVDVLTTMPTDRSA